MAKKDAEMNQVQSGLEPDDIGTDEKTAKTTSKRGGKNGSKNSDKPKG